jgi:ankyrin repeat protein
MLVYQSIVQEKDSGGNYPIHLACENHQYENVVLRLINVFPQAVKEKNMDSNLPFNLACLYEQSEREKKSILDLHLIAVKHSNNEEDTVREICDLPYTVADVFNELFEMSDYSLQNRIGIPPVVSAMSDFGRRQAMMQWLLLYDVPEMEVA